MACGHSSGLFGFVVRDQLIANSAQKESVTWSELLQNIEEGYVKKVDLEADVLGLRPLMVQSQRPIASIGPGARLLDASYLELKEAITEHEEAAPVQSRLYVRWPRPIGVVRASATAAVHGRSVRHTYFFVFRRMGQAAACCPLARVVQR